MASGRGSAGQRLLRERKGNFAVMTAAMAAVLMLTVGFAVNIAQVFNVKTRLGNALDAAVTSTALDITTGQIGDEDDTEEERNAKIRQRIEDFLMPNGEHGLIPDGKLVLDRVDVDPVARTIAINAYVDVDLFLPLFSRGPTQRVRNSSAAVYSDQNIEVAMILDVTLSMKGQKINDLKKASKSALDILLSRPRVRVALVPYSSSVRVGTVLKNTIYVEQNFTTGNPPGMYDPKAVTTGRYVNDGCTTERKGDNQFTDAGPAVAMVNRDYRMNAGWCPSEAVTPLASNLATLEASVDRFHVTGSTAGHIGIQWGWYLLSQNWADVLPESAKPKEMDPHKVAKVAILMTDGEFNTAYAGVPDNGEKVDLIQTARSPDKAVTLCKAMRARGIQIFTIGFFTPDLKPAEAAAARKTLKDCATSDVGSIKHFYSTSSGDELDSAFRAIAGTIQKLALTR